MKNNSCIRAISIILLSAAIVSASACSASGTAAKGSDDTSADTSAESEAQTSAAPELPKNIDMNGKTFTILSEGFYEYSPLAIVDIHADEQNGDSFNDSVYKRQSYMEETYNCKIEEVAFGNDDEAHKTLNASVMSGLTDYDIALIRGQKYMPSVTAGLLLNLDELTYTDFDKPWWDKYSMEQLSITNKHYVITSDITTTDDASKWCIYFNKSMVLDYSLENPYQLVKDGGWTLDKMLEMTANISADIDNNNEYNNKDKYGITYLADSSTGLINGFGLKIAELDKDGVPYLSIKNEKAISSIIQLFNDFSDEKQYYNIHTRSSNSEINKDETGMFMNGQSLFSIAGIYYCRQMREMNQDFGILPYPKYDESQSRYYYPTSATAIVFLAIPATNNDLDNTSIFLEDFAYQGYKLIRPAFYDLLLHQKVARDDESQEMLDMLFSDTFLDIGNICSLGGISGMLVKAWGEHDTAIASLIAKSEAQANEEIASIIETIS